MTEQRVEYRPASYKTLEPGLRAAVDLLALESRNAGSAGDHADASAYWRAKVLLEEQIDRLKVGALSAETAQWGV